MSASGAFTGVGETEVQNEDPGTRGRAAKNVTRRESDRGPVPLSQRGCLCASAGAPGQRQDSPRCADVFVCYSRPRPQPHVRT